MAGIFSCNIFGSGSGDSSSGSGSSDGGGGNDFDSISRIVTRMFYHGGLLDIGKCNVV